MKRALDLSIQLGTYTICKDCTQIKTIKLGLHFAWTKADENSYGGNMPKKPIKKSAPKSKPKAKAKMKAPPKPKLVAKKHDPSPRGFMWKALEQKQAELKQRGNMPAAGPMPVEPGGVKPLTDSPTGFSRFNGPRRRAG